MTYPPAKLLDLRAYLRPRTGLSDNALGIVADGWGHGYHRGKDSIDESDDHSVTESSRDRAGLTNAASAIDIGLFDRTTYGRRRTLRGLSLWLVEQCKRGTRDTRDIRSIIYTPDGRVVRRWDRLGIRSSGDDSHLTHTHISYFRDSQYRDKIAVFRRYFDPRPTYRRPLAAYAAAYSQEVNTVPRILIKHANHHEIFAIWESGLARHIGTAEYGVYKAAGVQLTITNDKAEYDRLIMYTRALQR
ncbi:MAG: hypothetical protein ACRDT4_01140 [Micromonosporaceae bacterium]